MFQANIQRTYKGRKKYGDCQKKWMGKTFLGAVQNICKAVFSLFLLKLFACTLVLYPTSKVFQHKKMETDYERKTQKMDMGRGFGAE